MATCVRTAPSFTSGKADVLFEGRIYVGPGNAPGRGYDTPPDGERFLMIKEANPDGTSAQELILVQNWFEELERLVPTEN